MSEAPQSIAARLRAAFEAEDPELLSPLLDPAVRWGGEEETPETCHGREEVIACYGKRQDQGVQVTVTEVIDRGGTVVIGFDLAWPESDIDAELPTAVYQVFKLDGGRVVDIRSFSERQETLEPRSPG